MYKSYPPPTTTTRVTSRPAGLRPQVKSGFKHCVDQLLRDNQFLIWTVPPEQQAERWHVRSGPQIFHSLGRIWVPSTYVWTDKPSFKSGHGCTCTFLVKGYNLRSTSVHPSGASQDFPPSFLNPHFRLFPIRSHFPSPFSSSSFFYRFS